MRVLLPYYHARRSAVHAVHPDVKILFVGTVLLACWFGVYGLPIAWSYSLLGAMVIVASLALMNATSVRGAGRVLLLPLLVAVVWVALYVASGLFHAWAHTAGWATDPLDEPLTRHAVMEVVQNLRRVVAFLAAAAAAAAFVVSTSISDLRRARLVPGAAVESLELFMSMFTRFQARARRILHAHALVGHRITWQGLVRVGPSNALVVLAEGLVVFVITILRDVPALFTFRALRTRVIGGLHAS